MKKALYTLILIALPSFVMAEGAKDLYLASIGGYGTEKGKFKNPQSVTVNLAGDIFVIDSENNRIQVFNGEGSLKKVFTNKKLNRPSGIAVDKKGNIFITDCSSDRVYKFSSSYSLIKSWGGRGEIYMDSEEDDIKKLNGKFDCPYGITVDNDGNLFVTDLYNKRIQKFTNNGKFIKAFGKETDPQSGGEILEGRRGSADKVTFRFPTSIAYGNEKIFITDTLNNRVQVFSTDGDYIKTIGGPDTPSVRLDSPSTVATDKDGNIYIGSFKKNNIFVLDKHYVRKTYFGNKGIGQMEFQGVSSIDVDDEGSIYVADYLNHRVKKFKSPFHQNSKQKEKDSAP